LLCARRERPCGSRPADEPDELAALHHSITSSKPAFILDRQWAQRGHLIQAP